MCLFEQFSVFGELLERGLRDQKCSCIRPGGDAHDDGAFVGPQLFLPQLELRHIIAEIGVDILDASIAETTR